MSAPGLPPARPALTLRAVDARLVQVPMRRPLHTSTGRMTHAPLVLIDVHTEQGVTSRSYLFCYLEPIGRAVLALTREVAPTLAGLSAQPDALRRVLIARYRLAGIGGPIASMLAGLDIACWDALAVAAELPLVRLLGAEPRPVPAYNSNGLGPAAPEAVAAEAVELAAEGMATVKLRLGRPAPEDDRAAVEAVRRALPQGVAMMADYNQALDLPAARVRCWQLDDLGLTWIEEPIRHDDYAGAAELAAQLRTPIQLGENFAGPRALSRAPTAQASDLVMPDPDRIGGVTGWLRAAALADVAAIPMSSHLYPEISTHLLAATPTAHWLEYVDWVAPLLREPLDVATGAATPRTARVPASSGTRKPWRNTAWPEHARGCLGVMPTALLTAWWLERRETSGRGVSSRRSCPHPEVSVAHRNARLTPHGRLLLVTRVLDQQRPVAHVVAELGVSRATGYKWLDRYRREGLAGLLDRASRAHRCPHRTNSDLEAGVVELRQQRKLGPARIAPLVSMPASTVHAVLVRRGLSRLALMDRPTGQPVRRYERDRPGELVHVDVTKLGRLRDGGGWRVHSRDSDQARAARHAPRVGFDYVHAAIDDHTRLAYAEIHPDERADTCAGFLRRAAAALGELGVERLERVMTDNALAYRRSAAWSRALAEVGAKACFTRRYRPQTNCEGVVASAPGSGLTPRPTGPRALFPKRRPVLGRACSGRRAWFVT